MGIFVLLSSENGSSTELQLGSKCSKRVDTGASTRGLGSRIKHPDQCLLPSLSTSSRRAAVIEGRIHADLLYHP
jgi:hypothetical protein